jgi:PIN domain nuclease of toxin-antitoxin system
MKLLLDTHLLLWAALEPHRLSAAARKLLEDPYNELIFSAASIWEVAIKSGLSRVGFEVDPRVFRRGLLDNGYEELAITSFHTVAVGGLPPIHRDPFDRLLIAQSMSEGIILLTSDPEVAKYGETYPAPIRLV